MARLAWGALALALVLASTSVVVEAQSGEDPAYSYYYTTNLYSQADEIQTVLLGFDMASTYRCAALCKQAIGGICKSWTFCWGTGFCNLMARVPDSVIKTEGGKPTYNPKCASGIVKGASAGTENTDSASNPEGSGPADNSAIPTTPDSRSAAPTTPDAPGTPDAPAAPGAPAAPAADNAPVGNTSALPTGSGSTGRASPYEGQHILIQFGNECTMPIVAATHYKALNGGWVTSGWFSIAPGQTKDVAKTRNTIFYSYANEKGDASCVRGCWSGEDVFDDFDGRSWGFKEQSVSADTGLGDTYRLAFTCDKK